MGKNRNISASFIILVFLTVFISLAVYAFQEKVDDILNKSSQVVVSIIVYDSDKKEIAQGKGVIVSPEGLVLTNYHLICQGYSVKVRLAEGEKARKKVDWENVFYPGFERQRSKEEEKKKLKGKWVNVEGLVSMDKEMDFALLKLEKKDCASCQISPSDRFEIGDRAIIAVDDESITEGTITGLSDLVGTKKIAQFNLPLSPDMSGSPVFNSKGEVTGIASYITDRSIFIFPACYALSLIQEGEATPLSKCSHEDYFASCEGLYLKGTAFSLRGDYDKSLRIFEESLMVNPKYPPAYSQMGFLLTKLKRYEEAIAAYQKALGLNPDDYKALFGLGMAYVRAREYQKAIVSLTQCTKVNPDFPDAFYNLGFACETLGQLDKAAEAYQQFIKINPGPALTGLNQLGSVYVKMGQYDKAIATFQEVMESNPSDLKAVYNLAYACDMSGQYDLAATHYRKLISLNPKDARTYQELLFRLFDKAGQYEKAIEIGQEILKQSPDNPSDHFNLGIIYYKKEDFENALEAYNKALSLNQNFEPAYYNIGLVQFRQEKYGEAIEAFIKFTELRPGNPDAHYNIGAGYLQLKKYDEAIDFLQRTIKLRPDYALAHYNLAIAYYAVNDRFSAEEEYKTLRTLNPELAEKLSKIIHK